MQLQPEYCLIIGLTLIGVELLIPGVFLLWIGLAALGVAGATYLWDITAITQLVWFGVLAPTLSLIGKIVQRHEESHPCALHLNNRASSLIGQTIILTDPLVNGKGQHKIADTLWQLQGPDLKVGSVAEIKCLQGNTLIIEERVSS